MAFNGDDLELMPFYSYQSDTESNSSNSDDTELVGVKVDPGIIQELNDIEQNNANQNLREEVLEPTIVEVLFKAFEEDKADQVKRILQQENINVNTRFGRNQCTFVHLAALHDSINVLRALLVDPTITNDVDKAGRSPLHWAVWKGHKRSVALLVQNCPKLVNSPVKKSKQRQHGAFPHTACPGRDLSDEIPPLPCGLTPLHLAGHSADIECVRLLLAARADYNALDGNNLTPLDTVGQTIPQEKYDTAAESFLQVIKALSAKRDQPTTDLHSMNRETPMHIAVKLNCVDAIPVLAKAGYNTPVRNKMGNTPLHIAAGHRSEDPNKCPLTTLVSVYGRPGIECGNNAGETPLHVAVQKQWLRAVTTLLDKEADITAETVKKKTVLHMAANNHVIMGELLKHRDCSKIVNKVDSAGNTPLFLSLHAQNIKCVLLLLGLKADLTQLDSKNRTVLHCGIERKNTAIVEALFKHNIQASENMIDAAINNNGPTALHIAAKRNYSKGVEILVKHNCNLKTEAMCEDGNLITALQWATIKGHINVVTTLLKADPSLINISDKKGMKPIHWACINRNSKIITILVNAGSDLSAKCTYPGKSFETTAMDLLIHRVPYSVDLLNKCMDSSFKVTTQSIGIDYKILLPENDDSRSNINNTEMKVLNALVQTGNQVNQRSLFEHPLIESFLHLQWKRISNLYYFLVINYMALAISFSVLVVIIFSYEENALSENPLYGLNVFLRVVIALCSSIHIIHEILYMSCTFRNPTWKLLTLKMKRKLIVRSLFMLVKIAFTLVICVLTLVDPTGRSVFPREVATGAIILIWVQFMMLASRIPTYGFYMLMFFEVTANFFVVLSSFTFIIVAFMITFFIEFQDERPFDTKSGAFLKTIVMMTNEFEYNETFKDVKGSMAAQVFIKIVFLFFVLLVGIVIMNILLGKAIMDIEKVDRLRKQAEFLSTYEHFFGCHEYLKKWLNTEPLEERKLKISFDLEDLQFPKKLMHTILDKAYAVNDATKKQYKDKPMQNDIKKDSHYSNGMERINSGELSTQDQSNKQDPFMELNRKIDRLTKKIDLLTAMTSSCSQCQMPAHKLRK